jgi:transcriptional regulator with XRE-family HTH domain
MKRTTNYEEFKKKLLEDPEVRKEYEALEPEYRLIRDIVIRRKQLNISQQKLAELIETKQPAISRIEQGDVNVTLGTLIKLADALNSKLEISLADKQELEPTRRLTKTTKVPC